MNKNRAIDASLFEKVANLKLPRTESHLFLYDNLDSQQELFHKERGKMKSYGISLILKKSQTVYTLESYLLIMTIDHNFNERESPDAKIFVIF